MTCCRELFSLYKSTFEVFMAVCWKTLNFANQKVLSEEKSENGNVASRLGCPKSLPGVFMAVRWQTPNPVNKKPTPNCYSDCACPAFPLAADQKRP